MGFGMVSVCMGVYIAFWEEWWFSIPLPPEMPKMKKWDMGVREFVSCTAGQNVVGRSARVWKGEVAEGIGIVCPLYPVLPLPNFNRGPVSPNTPISWR